MAAELFGHELAQHADFPAVFEMLTDAMRGAAARAPLRSAGGDQRLIAEWTAATRNRLSGARPG
jgi:hypothetical protein